MKSVPQNDIFCCQIKSYSRAFCCTPRKGRQHCGNRGKTIATQKIKNITGGWEERLSHAIIIPKLEFYNLLSRVIDGVK